MNHELVLHFYYSPSNRFLRLCPAHYIYSICKANLSDLALTRMPFWYAPLNVSVHAIPVFVTPPFRSAVRQLLAKHKIWSYLWRRYNRYGEISASALVCRIWSHSTYSTSMCNDHRFFQHFTVEWLKEFILYIKRKKKWTAWQNTVNQ